MSKSLFSFLEDEQIDKVIRVLDRKVESFNQRLIPMSEYHPNLSISYTVPRGLKDLLLLYVIRNSLPVTLKVEIEKQYGEKYLKLKGKEFEHFSNYLRKLLSGDSRFLDGRIKGRLIFLLQSKVRVNFIFSRTVKRKERVRGYKDHGSMRDESLSTINQRYKDPFEEKYRFYDEKENEARQKKLLNQTLQKSIESEIQEIDGNLGAALAEELFEREMNAGEAREVDPLPQIERFFDSQVLRQKDPYKPKKLELF